MNDMIHDNDCVTIDPATGYTVLVSHLLSEGFTIEEIRKVVRV